MINKCVNIENYNSSFVETLQETFSRFGWENHITKDGFLECTFPKDDKIFWEKFVDYFIP